MLKRDARAETRNSRNLEHRAVIKFFVKKWNTPKQIFEETSSILGDSAPSYTEVCEDDPRPGGLVTIATEENI